MAAYTTLRSTFGRLPDNVDDDRFVDAWAELVADAIENSAGCSRSRERPARVRRGT